MADTRDLIIIGAGIAGLTAATTAARLGLDTLVISGDLLGGHLVTIERIDGYPGHPEGIPGYDLCPATEEQASEAGAGFLAETATALEATADGWQVATESGGHAARAVILATGTTLKALGVPGESRLAGKGVSHCASCDAPLLKGKPVVVIGGGDSACQEALTLVPVASMVTILTDGPELTTQANYRDRLAAAGNVEVRTGIRILDIEGDDGVTGVRIAAAGTEDVIPAASVFIFIGLKPASALAPADLTSAAGEITVDASLRTTLRRLYAAGTVRAGATFRAASSAGDGAAAALSAYADLTAQ